MTKGTEENLRLLQRCVRARFHGPNGAHVTAHGSALILAIEGLQWLLGECSSVTKRSLQREDRRWARYEREQQTEGQRR